MSERDRIGEIYAVSYRRLVVQLYAVTGDMADAQDVVQESFVRALAAARTVADLDNPEAWLRRVAVNLARTRWRRRQVLDRLLRRVGPTLDVPEVSAEHLALQAAMRTLPTGQREAIALHYLSDLPIDEVATALSVSVGTVKSRLHRGRAALAALLDEPADGPDAINAPPLDRLARRADRRVLARRAAAAAVLLIAAVAGVFFLTGPRRVTPAVPVPTPTWSPSPSTSPTQTGTLAGADGDVIILSPTVRVLIHRSCTVSVQVSTNGGRTWSEGRGPVHAVDCLGEPDENGPTWIVSDHEFVVTHRGQRYHTTDAGLTWQ